MFEKYTERSRRIIFLARMKAGRRGASSIETADLVASIIIEDQGGFKSAVTSQYGDAAVAGLTTQKAFFTPEAANAILKRLDEDIARSSPLPDRVDMPLDNACIQILTEAAKLADELMRKKIEPLHLLAAALEEESSGIEEIFREAGITREKVIKKLDEGTP